MKLHAFIEANLDAIVGQWEAFARTLLPAAKTTSDVALGNHGREILMAIVADMRTSQRGLERAAGSHRAERARAATGTVATTHGAMRHGAMRHAAGFELAQVVSEFSALRSGVLMLWHRFEASSGETSTIEEIACFNEAIDQALGESVQRYSRDVAASRDMFLAMLGHDLRSPLQGIETASALLAMPALSETARLQTAVRVKRASKIMSNLVTDLLEYTRSRLGRGIPIERSACDLRQACEEALDAARAIDPEQTFVAHVSGDLFIDADCARLRQVLSNLLNNAIQHGDKHAPVSLSARGEEEAIVLAIANAGKPIPPEALATIFEPLVQVPATTSDLTRRPKTSIGLGLFIVREIVLAHHGTIDVQSSAEAGTVFTIRLPRASSVEDDARGSQGFEPGPA
jgi:signal transduction histidine kinase